MPLEVYHAGQGFESNCLFVDKLGVLADPGAITAVVTDPAGVDTPYAYAATIDKLAVGSYVKQMTAGALTGLWTIKWAGTGAVTAVYLAHWLIADDRE